MLPLVMSPQGQRRNLAPTVAAAVAVAVAVAVVAVD